MVDFYEEAPKSRYHGDVVLKVEEVNLDDRSVTGHDLRTGEEFTISLATPDEIAKHFANQQERQRTFSERVANAEKRVEERPDLFDTFDLKVGGVVNFEAVRTFRTPGGDEKTAAIWPTALARNDLDEAPILGAVQANHRWVEFETKKGDKFAGYKVDFNVIQEEKTANLADFDFDAAFSGKMDGVVMDQSGVVVTMRNQSGAFTVSSLDTPFRSKAEPSIEAALDKTHQQYAVYAAAVVAASTGAREFKDLKFADNVSEQKIKTAEAIYNEIKNNDGNPPTFEVSVMPEARVGLIPKKSTERFLKDYFGTRDGKPRDGVEPDPKKSYLDKGYVPSMVAMSNSKSDPENNPAAARFVVPQSKFELAEMTGPRSIKAVGIESHVKLNGETFGANAPKPEEPADKPQRAARSRSGYDAAPM